MLNELCSACHCVALQMVFRQKATAMQRSFQLTREAYETVLRRDCSQPCERVAAHAGRGIDPEHDAMLDKYNLCDVCGMACGSADSSRGKMNVCGCCIDNNQWTVACMTCIPWEIWIWLQADPENRHWRCKSCRSVFGILSARACTDSHFLHAAYCAIVICPNFVCTMSRIIANCTIMTWFTLCVARLPLNVWHRNSIAVV